jgi:hypothetical protein
MDDWETPEERLKGAMEILRSLVAIAGEGEEGGVALLSENICKSGSPSEP